MLRNSVIFIHQLLLLVTSFNPSSKLFRYTQTKASVSELSMVLGDAPIKQLDASVEEAVVLPKIIHTFWEGPPNDLARRCIHRMKRLHSTWRVIVHTRSSAEDLPGMEDLIVQHVADWTRLCVLAKHGGVWLDATIICTRSIREWVDMSSPHLQAFGGFLSDDSIENFAMAAPPGNPLILAWKNELYRAFSGGVDAYCMKLPAWVRGHNVFRELPYLTSYACYLMASRHNRRATVRMLSACEVPLKYQNMTRFENGGMNYALAMLELSWVCMYPEAIHILPPLIKLGRRERDVMECMTRFLGYCTISDRFLSDRRIDSSEFASRQKTLVSLFQQWEEWDEWDEEDEEIIVPESIP